MKKCSLLSLLVLISTISFSQVQVGIFGGLSQYQGDLLDRIFVGKTVKPAFGVLLGYELSEKVLLRGGLTLTKVAGSDRYMKKDYLRLRNLSFESKIVEGSLVVEYSILNLNDNRLSPYVFGGLAAYHFDPYTFDLENNKYYLRPLSTEGQGLPQYPEIKKYSLNQIAIPFGGGIKYALTENIHLGLELGFRKLFTDHLDDVSHQYVDENDLLTARGPLAVDLAYRGDEVPGGNPIYPQKGQQRGSNKYNDLYYLTGLTLSFRLGNGGGGGGRTFGSNFRRGYGCPSNPM
ncbi:MAG: outer membrane beta-barrel protein [Flavisolibacter sp.]|nr:outer membrane beta-barrel protein [Flavisolibacter sp.]